MPPLRSLTLGCKVNQYETEYLRQGLETIGYWEADEGEPAELCIVNTCTVTGDGDAKSRKLIRQLARRNPHAAILVMGCYATRAPDEVASLPGVAEVITDKRQLGAVLQRWGVSDPPRGIGSFPSRHRAYVKVQDGCRMKCSFCIIPSVRPNLVSRSFDDVTDEVQRLVAAGHREIVLTGIHLGHYGVDWPGEAGPRRRLAELVRRLAQLPGDFRIRLSSLEASETTPELLAVARDHADRVCPHLHIALQSGADPVLRRMRRPWSASRFVERCLMAREVLDRPALTTDVIVGFPGETDADFEATCRVIEQCGFSKLHIFRYSPREGTPAAEMAEQVHGRLKQERSAALAQLGDRLRAALMQNLVGQPLQVLVESPIEGESGHMQGTCQRYCPVELPATTDDAGRLLSVTAGPVVDGRIVAV